MAEEYQVGEQVVLRLAGRIEGTTIAAGLRVYQVRLETGDLLSLMPEQFAAAVDGERARHLLLSHLLTGEPLGSDEVGTIAAASLASWHDFDMTGGDLWRHVLLQEDGEE